MNFALDNWIKVGQKAKPCLCISDSVKINMKEFSNYADKTIDEISNISVEKPQKKKRGRKRKEESNVKAEPSTNLLKCEKCHKKYKLSPSIFLII